MTNFAPAMSRIELQILQPGGFPMKRLSIKTAILIPLLAGLIIGISVLSLIAINRASNIVTRLTDERTYGAARAVTAMFQNLEEESRVVSVSVASNYTVINNVLNWNADIEKDQSRQNLINYLRVIVRTISYHNYAYITLQQETKQQKSLYNSSVNLVSVIPSSRGA